jgi:hypothetical protein
LPSISKVFAYASLCFAALSATGCSTASTNNPGIPSAALPPTIQSAVLGRNASSSDLLYITNYGTSTVKAYYWPSLKSVQTLKGFNRELGLCTDKNGNVFIANTNANDIVEYAHDGKKPIATLNDAGYYPDSCAVDPVSGDLAVTNLTISGTANVVIFRHATGHPRPYTIPTIYSYYMCGYDDRGNLIVDGYGYGSNAPAAFAILPHGAQHLQKLTLGREPAAPGGIQWDGKYWAIGDLHSTIYRFDVTGQKGTKVGTTTLQESSTVFEFFISGDRVIAPEHETDRNQPGRQAEVFKYPAGGAAIGSIHGLNLPFGAVVSHGV